MSDKLNQAQFPLFTVIFEDGSQFVGGTSYFETKWMEIPLKKIKRIFYKLPTNDYICLDGYENYYHMVEATKDWMRIGGKKGIEKLSNAPKIEYAYIMGKLEDKVISYRIILSTKFVKSIVLSLKNDKEEKTITCSLRAKFNNKNKSVGVKELKTGDEISLYNYSIRKLETFKIMEKKQVTQSGRYKTGDVTMRIFDINDPQITKLNPDIWR